MAMLIKAAWEICKVWVHDWWYMAGGHGIAWQIAVMAFEEAWAAIFDISIIMGAAFI